MSWNVNAERIELILKLRQAELLENADEFSEMERMACEARVDELSNVLWWLGEVQQENEQRAGDYT